MNAAPAAETAGKEVAAHFTDETVVLHRVSSSKRDAAENVGLVCVGALLLAAACGALDLGLAADARTALSVAACCAVLAGVCLLFRDASESFFLRGRRQREQQQQQHPPTPTTSGVRRKIEQQQAGEVLDEPRPSTSDRLSRSPSSKKSPSCDGGPHGTTAHEPKTPEPTLRRTSSNVTLACKQQSSVQKPTTPEPSSLRRTSRPRKPSRRYNTGDWVL